MAQRKLAAVVLISMTLAAVFLTPLSSAVASGTGIQTVGNAPVTADVGNYVDLEGYNIQSGSVNVTGESGNTLSEGTDYEINYSEGSIKALSGGSISDGEELTVSYEYRATSSTTTTVARLLPLFAGLLILGTAAVRIRQELT